MKIGDVVIVKENADWSPEFKQKRKFIVVKVLHGDDSYDYCLKSYNWSRSLKDEVFNGMNDYVYILESDVKDLIILDKEFIKTKPLVRLVL